MYDTYFHSDKELVKLHESLISQEYAHVMARVCGYAGKPEDLVHESASGLTAYLFGPNKMKQLRKEDFLKFQTDLINDLLWLEFSSYLSGNQTILDTISDEDFCTHLLATANLTKKKKMAMVRICRRLPKYP